MATSPHQEAEAIESVCTRLAQRYPQVPAETVRQTVHDIYHSLDGPVRDYVPVLVEHIARNELTGMARVSA